MQLKKCILFVDGRQYISDISSHVPKAISERKATAFTTWEKEYQIK